MPLKTIFTKNDGDKEEKNQIHKHIWLSITWKLNKSNSMQSLIEGIS